MALLTAIIAGIGYLTYWQKPDIRAVPSWFWAILIFVVWAWITSFWSPYEDTKSLTNSAKVIVGFLIYCGVFFSLRALSVRSLRRLFTSLAFAIGLTGLLLFTDLLSNFALTDRFDPPKPGEEIHLKHIQTLMNLGHSAAIVILILPLVIMWGAANSNWLKILVWSTAIIVLGASILGKFNVGILALPLMIVAWRAASRFPITTVKSLLVVMMSLILFAPVVGWVARFIPDSVRSQLPASWDHRLVMWEYVLQKIGAHPLLGYGFDASRTFADTFVGNDNYEMTIVSLHPHNFGLQIWVETGLVGAILALAAIIIVSNTLLARIQTNANSAPMIAAYLVGLIVIGAVSYGVWQEWLWATIILITALYNRLGNYLEAPPHETPAYLQD